MEVTEYAEEHELTRIGNDSFAGVLPKQALEDHDLLDENGEPCGKGIPFRSDENDAVGIYFAPKGE